MKDPVILIDKDDNAIGLMDKLEAHKRGLLHRAFSIFIFDHQGRLLLQRRASTKYHSPNLWTNTCCSHPKFSETYNQAANRRLLEELGIVTPLKEMFSFTYKAYVGQGLIEHELDHVFFGFHEGKLNPNPEEVSQTRYIALDELLMEMERNPQNFTEWFKICFEQVLDVWPKQYSIAI